KKNRGIFISRTHGNGIDETGPCLEKILHIVGLCLIASHLSIIGQTFRSIKPGTPGTVSLDRSYLCGQGIPWIYCWKVSIGPTAILILVLGKHEGVLKGRTGSEGNAQSFFQGPSLGGDDDDPVTRPGTVKCRRIGPFEHGQGFYVVRIDVRNPRTKIRNAVLPGTRRAKSAVVYGHPIDHVEGLVVPHDGVVSTDNDTRAPGRSRSGP